MLLDYGQSSSYKVEPEKAKSQLSVPRRMSKRKAASPAPAPTIKKSKVSTEFTQVKRKKVVATPTNDAVSNKVLPNKEKKVAKVGIISSKCYKYSFLLLLHFMA